MVSVCFLPGVQDNMENFHAVKQLVEQCVETSWNVLNA